LSEEDRSWTPKASSIRTQCNAGPAILYTAIVVTLLHIGIVLGGYFYYQRFRYSASGRRIKLFSSPSFSRENIVRESFGGPSSSNFTLSHGHHLSSRPPNHMQHNSRNNGHHNKRSPPPPPPKPTIDGSSSSAHNPNVFYSNNRKSTERRLDHLLLQQQHEEALRQGRAFTSFYSGGVYSQVRGDSHPMQRVDGDP